MHTENWVRTTQYKFFKWVILTRIDTGTDYSGEQNGYQIVVSPEYYKAEFENKPNENRKTD